MLNTLTDRLNNVHQLVAHAQTKYPDDQLRFAAAVTILETRSSQPIRWSWQRLFQRRGSVVFTNQRVLLTSSWFSLYTLIYVSLIVLCAVRYTTTTNLLYPFFGLLLIPFLLQRLPYYREISLRTIQSWQLDTVQGISAHGSLVTIVLSNCVVQIVTSATLTHEFVATLIDKPEQ
jgi:hypothetical protein